MKQERNSNGSAETRRDFMKRLSAGAALSFLPSLAAAAPSAAAPALPMTSADVGSLFPFISEQAVHGEFPGSFLRDEFKSAAEWKQNAHRQLTTLLRYAPPPCDLNPSVMERVDMGAYYREKVYFNTAADSRVPAYLLIPKNQSKPGPAVVALHDHGAYYLWGKEKIVDIGENPPAMTAWREKHYAGTSIANHLAGLGYVVLVIDAFYWGERRLLLDQDPADWRTRPLDLPEDRIKAYNERANHYEDLVGRTICTAGFTWSGVMFHDDVKSVDYLASRPEVDKNRIGCLGLSMGGFRTCFLAALEPRIKAAVSVCWMASFPAQLEKKVRYTIGHTNLVPGLYQTMDYPDAAAMAMPNALLVLAGKRDALFDLAGVNHCFEKLAACYSKAGLPEKFHGHLFDSPHEFNLEMQAEAWAWLKKWL